MRVFVYEHLCARHGPSALSAEGRAMLLAALADLCALDVSVSTLVTPDLFPTVRAISSRLTIHAASATLTPRPPLPHRGEGEAEGAHAPEDECSRFIDAARGCDFALVIAPEFDDILATRCEWALEAGCELLGPSPEVVRLCADKLRLAEWLRERGLPTPETTLYPRLPDLPRGSWYVVKPRTGAGAQYTFIANSPDDAHAAAATAAAEGHRGPLLVQSYVSGVRASAAVLIGARARLTLTPACQTFDDRSPRRYRYLGGAVRYPTDLAEVVPLAGRAAAAVPGLFGYVGIDLIACGAVSGVIEINPRLTTSYVGLRRLSNVNLMRVLLDLARGIDPPPLSWKTGRVRFETDGTVHE
jgi:predicted ATP-grasp superfamily ATP-dependent carboligase